MGKKVMKEDPTALDLLRHARGLIEEGWAREAFARTKNGRPCDVEDPKAARFCLWGALHRTEVDLPLASGRVKDRAVEHLRTGIKRTGIQLYPSLQGPVSLISFNDNRSRKEPVLRAFDFAIDEALLEESILAPSRQAARV